MSKEEIIVPIEGYEKIKVKRCKHKQLVIVAGADGDWVYCPSCGLRTPSVPHRNGAWGEEIFEEAGKVGKLYRDFTRLKKIYFLDNDKKEISPSLCYADEEKEAWWLDDE